MSSRDILRQSDYELYLFSLFLPRSMRESAWAILAICTEWEAIARKTREPLAGTMRLAWWREQLDALHEGAPPPPHPALEALSRLMAKTSLPRGEWDRLLAAQARMLEEAPPAADAEFIAWAAETTAPWLHLIAATQGEDKKDYASREAWGKHYGVWRMAAMHAVQDAARLRRLTEASPAPQQPPSRAPETVTRLFSRHYLREIQHAGYDTEKFRARISTRLPLKLMWLSLTPSSG